MPDGSKIRISGTPSLNTKLEAERAERDHIARTLNPALAKKEVPTLTVFSDEYMRTYAATHNKPSELTNKKSIIEKHFAPVLGKKTLDTIGVREIESFRAKLLAEVDDDDEPVRSKKRVNNIVGVLMRFLRYAAEIGVIDAAPKIRPLKVPPSKFDHLDEDEYERLVAASGLFDPQRTPMIAVGCEAGLRKGEIIGLEWDDIDFVANTLTVRRSVWHDNKGKAPVGPPKSGRDRKLPMTDRLARG